MFPVENFESLAATSDAPSVFLTRVLPFEVFRDGSDWPILLRFRLSAGGVALLMGETCCIGTLGSEFDEVPAATGCSSPGGFSVDGMTVVLKSTARSLA